MRPGETGDGRQTAGLACEGSRTGGAAVLEVTDLSVAYPDGTGGTITVVAGMSFTVEPGDFLCLVGRSGSGKTSILRQLVGLAAPEPGRIAWDGADVAGMKPAQLADLRRTVAAYVDQDSALVDELSCVENVLLPLMPDGRRAVRARRGEALRTLKTLGLGERLRWRPARLSGGERQRVALARALVAATPTILADEPTASLDRSWADRVILHLREHAERGGSVIVASHDPAVARSADRTLHLEG